MGFKCTSCKRGYLARPTANACLTRYGSKNQYECHGKVVPDADEKEPDVHTYQDGKLGHQGGTSKAAAEKALKKAENLQVKVHKAFVNVGSTGFTDDELIERFGDISARPRRIGLMHKGIVADSGERRDTMAGRKAVVWKLKCFCNGETNADQQRSESQSPSGVDAHAAG